MIIGATGWWTSNHILVITNVVLAAATIATAVVALLTIRASNRVAAAAETQSKATAVQVSLGNEQVKLGTEQLTLGAQQLEQDKQAMLATIRPLVVDVPLGVFINHDARPGWDRDLGAVYWSHDLRQSLFNVAVPIRNIGNGPSFIRETLVTTGPTQVWAGFSNRRVLPAGEMGSISLRVNQADPLFGAMEAAFMATVGRLAVAIKYSDLGGDQRTQSVIYVEALRDSESRRSRIGVTTVALYRCDEMWVRETEPLIMTGSADLPW